MIYGYINVNTGIKSDEAELLLKKTYKDIKIYQENESKDILKTLLSEAKEGDTVIIFNLLELCHDKIETDCNKDELIKNIDLTYQYIFNQGINLELVDQPELNAINYRQAIMEHITTTSSPVIAAVSTLLSTQIKLSVIKSIGEIYEPDSVKKKPLKRGIRKGTDLITQKEKTSKKYMKEHLIEFGGDMSNTEIIKKLGIAKNTFFKYKRELLVEAGIYNVIDSEDDYQKNEEIPKQKKRPRGRPKKIKIEKDMIPGQMSIKDYI